MRIPDAELSCARCRQQQTHHHPPGCACQFDAQMHTTARHASYSNNCALLCQACCTGVGLHPRTFGILCVRNQALPLVAFEAWHTRAARERKKGCQRVEWQAQADGRRRLGSRCAHMCQALCYVLQHATSMTQRFLAVLRPREYSHPMPYSCLHGNVHRLSGAP